MKTFEDIINNFQVIDLDKADKAKLKALDEEVLNKLIGSVLNKLCSEMLKGELSPDFVNGAKFSLKHLMKYFRD